MFPVGLAQIFNDKLYVFGCELNSSIRLLDQVSAPIASDLPRKNPPRNKHYQLFTRIIAAGRLRGLTMRTQVVQDDEGHQRADETPVVAAGIPMREHRIRLSCREPGDKGDLRTVSIQGKTVNWKIPESRVKKRPVRTSSVSANERSLTTGRRF